MPRLLCLLVCLVPAWALSQTVGMPVTGTSLVINNNPGDQSEPRIHGTRVVYTQQLSRALTEVRYHDVSTGLDQAIPNTGAADSAPRIQGDTVLFTRAGAGNRLFSWNTLQGGAAQEVAPRVDPDRRAASLGGALVAFQESGYTVRPAPPEIFAFRQDTQSLTRLSEDTSVDRTPSVSVDGQTVVWSKCATSTQGCDIYVGRKATGGYTVDQLTGPEGEETQPVTNGDVVVYVSQRVINGVTEADIAFQPVGGGEALRLDLPGQDTHPSISGPLIVFEHWNIASATPNYDLMMYDLRTSTYYQLTQTPGNESLSDLSMGPDGVVRVVWAVRSNGEYDIHALVFRLPIDCPVQPPPNAAQVCAAPGERPLLATLQVTRSDGEPQPESKDFEGRGTGVLCVDNGVGGTAATEGWVWLGAGLAVAPDEFGEEVTSVSRLVPLQGRRTLSALVEGAVGSAFQVRLYGELSCSAGLTDAPSALTVTIPTGTLDPEPLEESKGLVEMAHRFVPEGYEGTFVPR